MELNDKTIKEIFAIIVVILFGILVFFAIQPLIFAILWGLIFAYIFMPLYEKALPYLKNKSLASLSVMLLAVLIILIPLWFIVPLIVQQVFEIFKFSQTLDIGRFVKDIFPTASEQFITQTSTTLTSLISKLSSAVINELVSVFLNIPTLILDVFVALFVFFFTLRDSDKLKHFVRSISPLSKEKEELIIKSFKDMTYSIIYGNFIVGFVQGLVAGLGFFVFGVKNALVLTIMAIFFCILPFAGAFIIWIPVAIYLFAAGNTASAIVFVLYNAIVTSNIDNVLRVYIIARKTKLSALFAFISSVGGLFLFGVIGLILGPLIFAYFIILIDLYREKNLLSLFSHNHGNNKRHKSK